jgi:hypothetical protein
MSAVGNLADDLNGARTGPLVMPIRAVAPQPAQANDGRARNRPIADRLLTINIIIAMMGAATTPLITAVRPPGKPETPEYFALLRHYLDFDNLGKINANTIVTEAMPGESQVANSKKRAK